LDFQLFNVVMYQGVTNLIAAYSKNIIELENS